MELNVKKLACVSLFISFFSGHSLAVNIESNTWFDIGSRADEIRWNIAGDINGFNPNIISELHWTEITSGELKVQSDLTLNNLYTLQGSFALATITSGDVRDSDYALDNRVDEFSRSNSSADVGDLSDFSAAAGMLFDLKDPDVKRVIRVTALLGFSFHRQSLSLTDGYQSYSNPQLAVNAGLMTPADAAVFPGVGAIFGLNSTYISSWYGPWVGANLWVEAGPTDALVVQFEYHLVDYYAEGDWNLRSDFMHPKSYEHWSTGSGTVLRLGWYSEVSNAWNLGLMYTTQAWKAEPGVTRFNFADGTFGRQQLNEVLWRSSTFALSLRYLFDAPSVRRNPHRSRVF